MFEDRVNGFSLLFKKASIERKYQKYREAEFQSWKPRAVLVCFMIVMAIALISKIKSEAENSDQRRFRGLLIFICCCVFSTLLECLIHCFSCLKYIRALVISVGLTFGATEYSQSVTSNLTFTPGMISVFFVTLYSNLLFGYNWMLSYGIAIVTQLTISIFLAAKFSLVSSSTSEIFFTLFNYNFFMLFLPFFFYFLEKEKRQITYLSWENQKEMTFWKKLVQAIPVGLIIAHGGEISFANKCLYSLLVGQSRKDRKKECLIGALKMTKSRSRISQSLYDLIFPASGENEELAEEKFVYQHGNDEELPIAVTIMTFKKGGEAYRICLIQSQKVIEELEQERVRSQYQKNFFAMVTHELRNPLHGIMGIFEIFQSMNISEKFSHHCKVGTSTSKLMMSLINDILDISQIEARKLALAEEKSNFVMVARESAEIMQFQYGKKKLSLDVCETGVIPEINNDKRRYGQIIINLLSNALKFTSHGGVKVQIEFDAAEQLLRTKVVDTGKGIKKEDLPKLFKMYEKLNSVADNPTGAGLGLLICHRLSEQMGGSIQADSEVGVGTTFTFSIKNRIKQERSMSPAKSMALDILQQDGKQEEEKFACNNSVRALLPDKDFSGVNALIIDDDFSSTFVLQQLCERLQMKIETASSGEEGVEIISRRIERMEKCFAYRLVFIDMHMPGWNGIETCMRIKKIYESKGISFTAIGLSGDVNEELATHCREAGMAEVLAKPFGKQEIIRVMSTYSSI